MAFPTGTEAPASSESHIDDLLGLGLPGDTSAPVEEDTSVADADTGVSDDTGATQDDGATPDDGTGADDAPDGGDQDGSEGDTGEEEFNVTGLEHDFAESAYQRAVAHWEKRGANFDLQNPGHRAFLKDWLERGEKITELNARPTETRVDDKPAEEARPVVKTPEEQTRELITNARTYAKESFNPVAAKEVMLPVAQALANFMWGKEAAAKFNFEGRSAEDIRELSEALHTAMSVSIADAIPAILSATPKAMSREYPMFDRVLSMAENESVVEELVGAKGSSGAPTYPGMDKLIDNGTIKRIMNGPELKDAVFTGPKGERLTPYQNKIAKAKLAYQMARGQSPNPQVVAKAVARGKEQQRERSRAVAAGRMPPGSSGRSFANTSKASLKDQILSPNKGGFHALLHQDD